MAIQRDLKAFVRYDGSGRVVAGSLILRKNKPKVGRWQEIPAYECCNYVPTTTTTTTASPTTTTTSTSTSTSTTTSTSTSTSTTTTTTTASPTTTTTTTVEPTTTTTTSTSTSTTTTTTTTPPTPRAFTGNATEEACAGGPTTTFYSVGPYSEGGDPQNGTILYTDSGLTTPVTSPFVYLFITGTVFNCTVGVLSNQASCG